MKAGGCLALSVRLTGLARSYGATAAGCSRPIRLAGQLLTVDKHTGQVLGSRDTECMPDGQIYTACGNRRASVCTSCSETYRADTYQLIHAGMAGGRHGCATVLLAIGVPPRTAMEILGHSKLEMTMNTHAHVSLDDKRAALDRINDLLRGATSDVAVSRCCQRRPEGRL